MIGAPSIFIGLRSPRIRSLRIVNKEFEGKHNADIRLLESFYFSSTPSKK